MRLLNKLVYTLCAVALFSSCSDDDNYSRGDYPLEGYENVSLPGTVNIEIEPSAPTTYTFEVSRADSLNEAVMPFEVIYNTDSVFEIEPVVFKAGERKSFMTINFSKAEVGKTYRLRLVVNDKNFSSPYENENYLDFTVSRVKWNDLGYMNDPEGNIYCSFYDAIVAELYGITGGDLNLPVMVQERDDKPGYLRIKDIYTYYPEAGLGIFDYENSPHYMYIDATDPNKVFIPEPYKTGLTITDGDGECYVWSWAGYYLALGEDAEAAKYYGKYENGKITFPKSSLIMTVQAIVSQIGGDLMNADAWLETNAGGLFNLTIDPTLEKYEADPRYDFDWEVVNNSAQFKSNTIGYSGVVSLYKGTCSVTTDGCDTVFANTYGDCYKLSNAYGQGEDLYFTVKDGTVGVPGDDYRLQYTGINTLGQKVCAQINTSGSKFSDKLIELNITYLNEDGSIEFGTGKDTISNVKYIEWGTGIFTFNNYLVQGPAMVTIYKEEGDDIFRIDDLLVEGMDLYFRWDRTTDNLYIDPQIIAGAKYDDGTTFPLGVMDVVSSGYADDFVSEGLIEDPRSYYDSDSKTFYFTTVYGDFYSNTFIGDDKGNPVIGDKETLEIVSSIEMKGKPRNKSLDIMSRTELKPIKRSLSRFKYKDKFSRFHLTPKKANKYSLINENLFHKYSFR